MNANILAVFGTRPETIKMGPVVAEFRRRHLEDHLLVVNTGQHRELQQPFVELFGLEPDHDLKVSREGLHLTELLARTLSGLQALINRLTACRIRTGCILAQGDTNTALAASLTAQLNRVSFAHLEAGLRSYRFDEPFPEEYNRRVAALNAYIHFAPTRSARDNLLREGVEPAKILLTGNTGVDALRIIATQSRPATLAGDLGQWVTEGNLVLITCHRRENLGNMLSVLRAVKYLAGAYPGLHFLWIQHPNSAETLERQKGGPLPSNLKFLRPVGYPEMLALYRACRLVITDSGGVQEEAAEFGLPVLVTRSVTERSEGVELGWAELTGTEPDRITQAFHRRIHETVPRGENPYGDGKAAGRIVEWFMEHLLSGALL